MEQQEPEQKARGPDRRLGRRRRLRRSANFQEAYAQGRRGFGRYMVMWLRTGPDASLRLGVVTSRKVGGAVERNRARRRLREAFRRHRHEWEGDCEVVLVARRDIVQASWPDLEQDLLALARRAGLVRKDAGSEGRP